ncbi:MAG: cytochrome C [Gammaproteobacteria bacterium]|nr:cytochrome C [Gammaproteobacteria bacterium]MBV9727560.1 cytochrome C [Gammaproteobacteria bacterium]
MQLLPGGASRFAAAMRKRRGTAVVLALCLVSLPRIGAAVPSFASQTGMPCSQCHVVSFGVALTAYGRQFKLNGYTYTGGDSPFPIAAMVQGGYTHTSAALPEPAAPHFATNDNLSVDQVSVFVATKLFDGLGMFAQGTYSGEDRHFSWDNLDVRWARPLPNFFGTDAVVGISVNNNPTVQDLWNSTPAWAYPYITSGLAPGPSAAPVIAGGLAQVALGATAYTMIHDHLYLEAGAYRGLSDHWLGNLGLYPDNNVHMDGASPYWRAAYQFTRGEEHYFSFGTFGLSTKLKPDPTVARTDHYSDFGFDGVYQYTPRDGPGTVNVNASVIHEKQQLDATFGAGGANNPTNHLTTVEADLTYAWRQTYALSGGVFNTGGSTDPTYFGFGTSGTPDTRGYILMLEWVPFGKTDSWARPWVNVRLGIQYTGYTRFDGGTSNYDGSGRSASDNNTLFLFYWLAF